MSKKREALDGQHKTAVLLVGWRIPGFLTSFIAAVASRSLILWVEFIENASILIPGILLLVLSRKLNKNLKFKYNYGTEKVEAITALCCEMFDLSGLLCILILAIRNLIYGSETGHYILFALIVSIFGLFIDAIILLRERRLSVMNHSKMLHTALVSAQKEFVFDIISIITLIIGVIFRESPWMSLFTTIVTIIMVIPFTMLVIRNMRGSMVDLTDLTLDEENQLKIVSILSEFYEHYEALGEVKSRMTGDKIFVDIELSFHDNVPYKEIRETVEQMRARVTEELGKCTVNIIIF